MSCWRPQCTPAAESMAVDRPVSEALIRGSLGARALYSGFFSSAEAWQTRHKSGFREYNEKRSPDLFFVASSLDRS